MPEGSEVYAIIVSVRYIQEGVAHAHRDLGVQLEEFSVIVCLALAPPILAAQVPFMVPEFGALFQESWR